MYSQFCFYIQQDEQKRHATMHIPRKPGQQIEVDWAGDTAAVIDRDTGEITKVYVFIAAHELQHLRLCRSLPGHEAGKLDQGQRPHAGVHWRCSEDDHP